MRQHKTTQDNIKRVKPPQVRAISLPWDMQMRIKKVSEKTGLKAAELHRLALNNFLAHVANTGSLPTPGLMKGDQQ